MLNLSGLRGQFLDSTILSLECIFSEAASDSADIEALQKDLVSVLQQEKSRGLIKWEISPSGRNHLIATGSLCLLVNTLGITTLFENGLFFEGELDIRNFEWMENDHLLVFELYYVVHNESQKCVCHYAKNESFVYFTPITKIEESFHKNSDFEVFDFGGWD